MKRSPPAKECDLVFTTDRMPGYSRIRRGGGFSYIRPGGECLTDSVERARIASLAIPPAYQNVWICQMPNGHLQATGFDARKRKQYRYHPAWHQRTSKAKLADLSGFVRALPRIRQRLARDLAGEDFSKDRVIAGIVMLLDLTGYRIGNSRYARENKTFGIASLLGRHLDEEDGQPVLRFRGKAGNAHRAEITRPKLVRLLDDLHELPGQRLFRYEDTEGALHDIESSDVNNWLKEVGGGNFTAKQFRTWRSNLICARNLAAEPAPECENERKKTIRDSITATAKELNHTAATCRKYYLHPALFEAYDSGRLYRVMHSRPPRTKRCDEIGKLRADERRLVRLLNL